MIETKGGKNFSKRTNERKERTKLSRLKGNIIKIASKVKFEKPANRSVATATPTYLSGKFEWNHLFPPVRSNTCSHLLAEVTAVCAGAFLLDR